MASEKHKAIAEFRSANAIEKPTGSGDTCCANDIMLIHDGTPMRLRPSVPALEVTWCHSLFLPGRRNSLEAK